MEGEMQDVRDRVLSLIQSDEVVALALALGNIASPAGHEGEIGRYLFDWLRRNEFSPRTVGFVPERSCVFGVLPGRGDGASLAFNSHMDTAKQKDDVSLRDPGDAVYQQAWLDGDYIMGHGIVNDKGPMAAWMAAANAIRQAGVSLRGDLVLTMVPGEIDQEPVDEFTSPQYLSKEVGARYLITRGVVADCALVAEGTNFGVAWAGAGKACFKVTVYGKTIYIPYLPPRGELTRSPNAIVKMAAVIGGLEQWAARYERDYVEETPGGQIVPKVNIGALRAGNPSHISTSSETCHLYMDVRLPPHADPLWIRADLRRVLADCGVEGTVELYTYRKAQVAEGIEPLADAVAQAHTVLGMDPPGRASPVYSSMWRDHIAFIEAGIPALTYGPGDATAGAVLGMPVADLVQAARSYALIALDVCSRSKDRARQPAGATPVAG
jgi:acetylornithine deacetylase/succinyl-diaminopimelate desuccinylase-like protein